NHEQAKAVNEASIDSCMDQEHHARSPVLTGQLAVFAAASVTGATNNRKPRATRAHDRTRTRIVFNCRGSQAGAPSVLRDARGAGPTRAASQAAAGEHSIGPVPCSADSTV